MTFQRSCTYIFNNTGIPVNNKIFKITFFILNPDFSKKYLNLFIEFYKLILEI